MKLKRRKLTMASDKEILDEINQMNKGFEGLFDEEEEKDEDSVATDPPAATDAPATDSPVSEEDEEKEEDKPQTDAPVTDAPLDEKDQIIADLRAKLEKPPATDAPAPMPATAPPLELAAQDFIGDEDVEDITGNKDSLNKLLNSVYTKGIADARKIINEGISGALPPIISSQIGVVDQMKEMRDNFYNDNEDLKSFPNVVSVVFDDIAKASPNKSYTDIISAVAPEARKRLNLKKPELKALDINNDDKSTPPKLPRKKGKSGRTLDKPKTSSVESQLDEMNKVLGR